MLPILPTPWAWSRDAFVSALALSLLHSLWQGAAIGGIALALRRRVLRATPDVRGGICLSLLLTIFALWLGTVGYLYVAQTHAVLSAIITIPGTAPLGAIGEVTTSNASSLRLTVYYPVLVALWALGVCVVSLRHVGGFLLLRRIYRAGSSACSPEWQAVAARIAVRLGLRRRVTLLCSARIDIPFAFGLLRPYILLPVSALTNLAPAQVEALIAHELAHLARHDVIVNALQICVETILFYHPVVRWLSVQIRDAREQRCDDLAVQVVGDRAVYARALYSLEEVRASLPQLALAARGDSSPMSNTHLLGRIQRILGVAPVAGVEKRDPWAKGALALGAATIGLVSLLPAHARSLQEAAKPADPPAATTNLEFHSDIVLNLNGDKVEVHGLGLKPDTAVTMNGKETRMGDLTPELQAALKKALSAVTIATASALKSGDGKSLTVNARRLMLIVDGDSIELPTTVPNPETHVKVNGVDKRFGQLPSKEQIAIRAGLSALPAGDKTITVTASAGASKGATRTVSVQASKKLFLKINGDDFELDSTEMTPDTHVKLNGVDTRFGDLSAAEQETLRTAVAAAPAEATVTVSHP